jgi:hypothetical protein
VPPRFDQDHQHDHEAEREQRLSKDAPTHLSLEHEDLARLVEVLADTPASTRQIVRPRPLKVDLNGEENDLNVPVDLPMKDCNGDAVVMSRRDRAATAGAGTTPDREWPSRTTRVGTAQIKKPTL